MSATAVLQTIASFACATPLSIDPGFTALIGLRFRGAFSPGSLPVST